MRMSRETCWIMRKRAAGQDEMGGCMRRFLVSGGMMRGGHVDAA